MDIRIVLTESAGQPAKRTEEERTPKEESDATSVEAPGREVSFLDGCDPKAAGRRNKRKCQCHIILSISQKVSKIRCFGFNSLNGALFRISLGNAADLINYTEFAPQQRWP